jgi:hypothetical protein
MSASARAESLRVRLLRILPGKIDERALFAALRDRQLDAPPDLLAQKVGQCFAIGKVYRHKNAARNVGLIDVELFQQCGEHLAGIEHIAYISLGG